jgi:hypothetical protein
MRGAVLTQIDRDAHYIPSISAIVLTKLRDYQPEKHRAMVGPIDRSAKEYEAICDELDHTERKVVEIALRRPEPVPA